jgi:hypothetical protein
MMFQQDIEHRLRHRHLPSRNQLRHRLPQQECQRLMFRL